MKFSLHFSVIPLFMFLLYILSGLIAWLYANLTYFVSALYKSSIFSVWTSEPDWASKQKHTFTLKSVGYMLGFVCLRALMSHIHWFSCLSFRCLYVTVPSTVTWANRLATWRPAQLWTVSTCSWCPTITPCSCHFLVRLMDPRHIWHPLIFVTVCAPMTSLLLAYMFINRFTVNGAICDKWP